LSCPLRFSLTFSLEILQVDLRTFLSNCGKLASRGHGFANADRNSQEEISMKRSQLHLAVVLIGLFAISMAAQDNAIPVADQNNLVPAATTQNNNVFPIVRSSGAVNAGCLPYASGRVTISPLGPVENMHVEVTGLPKNTEFDLFVIQLPNAPFGLSWYQGDIQTDGNGTGVGDFVGRFSIETFIVAPGSGPAPVIHPVDASSNPATAPVHTLHLGLWFGSAAAAAAAGCPATVTPFNGNHTAGIQALSTRNFANNNGPLRRLQ
jgi:hypothetical protein